MAIIGWTIYLLLSYPLNGIFCRMHYNKRLKGGYLYGYEKTRELNELSLLMLVSPISFPINLVFFLIHVIWILWTGILNATIFKDNNNE